MTRRQLGISLLVAWLALTAALTLFPSGYAPSATVRSFVCVGCGPRDAADFILNWLWFLPAGALAAAVLGGRWALALGVCLSAFIETVQIWVPGRNPALLDLVSNALGALSGVVLLRQGLTRSGQRLLSVAAGVAWLAPVALLLPETSPDDLYGLWTPSFGHVAQYEGRILDASVGRVTVPSRRVPEKAALDSAITRREPIRLRLEVGPPPATLAPVFQINDRGRREILVLGAIGPDLILRSRSPATILTLDEPDVRWDGALLGFAPGDTATVVVDRGRESVCMSVSSTERCRLAPSLSEGWGHLLYPAESPPWLRSLLALLWAAGLGMVVGATTPTRLRAVAVATALAVLGYVASRVTPDVRPDALGAATLLVGALIGTSLRQPIRRLWLTVRAM